MQLNGIEFRESDIANFCRRNNVRKLSLFGSILSPEFRSDSDVDVLVEFQPGRTPGMFGFGKMILELSEIIGRTVDLRTPFDLSPYLRPFILRDSKVLHGS